MNIPKHELVHRFDWFYVRDRADYSGKKTIVLYDYTAIHQNDRAEDTTPNTSTIMIEKARVAFVYQAKDDVPHGVCIRYNHLTRVECKTYFINGVEFDINPDLLTQEDKMYIELSGRLPEKFNASKSDIPQESKDD